MRFRVVKIYSSAQNGVKNVSDQSVLWIDGFAIIPTDLGKSVQFFFDITGLMVSALICMSLHSV